MDLYKIAAQYIGVKQGSRKHKEIIDCYNTITPLPRGYRVKYTDSWCAAFVSFVIKKSGYQGADVFECSAQKMFDRFKKAGYVLKGKSSGRVNDIIFYDWDTNGTSDHVGIIQGISTDCYCVIEGNKSKQVGVRTIAKNDKTIKGVARLQSETTSADITQIAKDVIAGKYGNGAVRKKALGDLYDEVQIEVNKILKG